MNFHSQIYLELYRIIPLHHKKLFCTQKTKEKVNESSKRRLSLIWRILYQARAMHEHRYLYVTHIRENMQHPICSVSEFYGSVNIVWVLLICAGDFYRFVEMSGISENMLDLESFTLLIICRMSWLNFLSLINHKSLAELIVLFYQ